MGTVVLFFLIVLGFIVWKWDGIGIAALNFYALMIIGGSWTVPFFPFAEWPETYRTARAVAVMGLFIINGYCALLAFDWKRRLMRRDIQRALFAREAEGWLD